MLEKDIKITVFTPTYNRAYILSNLYESLTRQTYKGFEWLIIDDGSSDDTDSLVNGWIQKESGFFINYVKQPNGGKCRAINRGLDLAHGKLFFTIDSDDYLTDDALEKIIGWDAELPSQGNYCGFAGNRGYDPTHTTNTLFENGYYEGNMLDCYKNVDGERAYIFYTKVHKKYKYPEFEGENFMTEAVAWNRMAHDGYKMRFYNDIIWIFEYLQDGLTKAGMKVFIDNPHGYALWLKEKILFEGAGFRQMLGFYYSMYAELCHTYDVAVIADCLQTNRLVVNLCGLV